MLPTRRGLSSASVCTSTYDVRYEWARVVDHGPYDHSWGGPSLAGAWLAHAAVSLPFAAAALGLLWLVAELDTRLGAHLLRGERPRAWVWPTALLACAGGALFVVAWIHQL